MNNSLFVIKKSNIVDLTFIFYFSFTVISSIISRLFGVVGIPYGGLITEALLVFFVICSILITKNKGIDFFIILAVILVALLITVNIHPEYSARFSDDNWGLLYRVFRIDRGIYAYLILRMVSDKLRIRNNLKITAYIWMLKIGMDAFSRITQGSWTLLKNDGVTLYQSSYSLSFGYNSAFLCVVCLYLSKYYKPYFYKAVGVLTLALSVLYGSRGALIVPLSYIFFQMFFFTEDTFSKKELVKRILIALAFLACILFYEQILSVLISMFRSLGLGSRSIESLIEGNIGDLNGRDNLWMYSLELIRKNFFTGLGPYGDRYYLSTIYNWGYPHNIFLEFLLEFGILGLIMLIVLIISSFKIIRQKRDYEFKAIFVVFFSNSLKLLVSDSFWYNSFFWSVLALIVMFRSQMKEEPI